jgi:uncharacterized protein (DUF302 family)
MKTIHFLLLTFLFSWVSIVTADSSHYDDNDFSISNFDTVAEAVASITTTLEDLGMEIVSIFDHSANATKVGLELAPTQLILFRNRHLEKKLLRRSSTVAIDLPQMIQVWRDQETDELKILYNSAGYLYERHGIRSRDRVLRHVNKPLNQFGLLDNGLVTIETEQSVEETVEKLKMVLLNNGFLIPFTFDFTELTHKGASQLIIFGNPLVGTLLMQNQQAIGLDLPLKFMVWEDQDSQVHITHNDLVFIGKRHGLQGLDVRLSNIANRLVQLANEGAGN